MGWFEIPRPEDKIVHSTGIKEEAKKRGKDWLKQHEQWLREQWATMAAKVCPLCSEPIGYVKAYGSDHEKDGLQHAACLWKKNDEEQAARSKA